MKSDTGKIKTLKQLIRTIEKLKKERKTIVHCHGVFDLIHPGHIRHFTTAKKYGDILVVTITADRFVKKGPERPVFNQDLRCEVLAAIGVVDFVAVIEADSAVPAIKTIKPHYYVKGSEYKTRKENANIPRKLSEEEAAVSSGGGKLIFTDEITFSSSHLINSYLDVYTGATKLFLESFRRKYSSEKIINDLIKIRNLKILVIGDAIIDQYHYSAPIGKSTKEPITVHRYLEEESFAGGTLATANHLAAFSSNLHLVSLLGKKKSFESFILKHLNPKINVKFFYHSGQTIIKRRFIDQYTNQKLFQISYLDEEEIGEKLAGSILRYLSKQLPKYDLVIVNDYGHGFLTKKIIRLVCRKAKYLAVNAQANSANYGFHVISKYPRADFVCIDETELRLATHERWGELTNLMKTVYKKIKCKQMLVTRGQYGSQIYSLKNGLAHVPSLTRKIVDRVGAGDALFSIAAPCAFLSFDQTLTAFLGNIAAALKIQTIGNKNPLDFKEMTKFITRLLK